MRIKCIFCKKPINIKRFAGITKEGFFCNNICCLIEFIERRKVKGGAKQ